MNARPDPQSPHAGNGWNFADVWETVADVRPDTIAHVHGTTRVTWRQFDRRANGVAAAFLKAGLERQAKVALCLYNGHEYLETAFAVMKAGMVPVNTNYRYGEAELEYLWTDGDVTAVVFDASMREPVAAVRPRLPQIQLWIQVRTPSSDEVPDWALRYEDLADSGPVRLEPTPERDGDDLLLLYTGGTTGMPKGVMWRQHDLYNAVNTTNDPTTPDLDHVRRRLASSSGPVGLPAAPLMHGTGFVFATTVMNAGGTVVTLTGRGFDVTELLDTIEREGVTALNIVGDAFCQPIVGMLDEHPDRWDLSTLQFVSSAGMVWSPELKDRLLAHAPQAKLIDFLNSSEASGMGRSVTTRERAGSSGSFQAGDRVVLIDDEGQLIPRGADKVGRIAVAGHLPLGYYKDPEKTAATFTEIGGQRYSIPGDLATMDADGTLDFVGRGSTVINSGGEKIFPEEVERTLKTHGDVKDAVVVGVPDPRFGEVVGAAVAVAPDANVTADDLRDHVRMHLAGYKAPRRLALVGEVPRSPNGKADTRAARKLLTQENDDE